MAGIYQIGYVIALTFIGFTCCLVGLSCFVYSLLRRCGMSAISTEDACDVVMVLSALCVIAGLALSCGIWWLAAR